MVENHGFFCQDSVRVEKLVTAIDHPNFGVLLDMGNFLCADDNPTTAVGRLLPYTFHCHAKDFHIKPGTDPYPGEGWLIEGHVTAMRIRRRLDGPTDPVHLSEKPEVLGRLAITRE